MSRSSDFGPLPTLQTGRAHPHPEPISGAKYSAVELMPGNRVVMMLDQRKLPRLERYTQIKRIEELAEAIRAMIVRGAPAIGIAAAYGMVLAAHAEMGDAAAFARAMAAADTLLRGTRPTAVNLAWALDRMRARVRQVGGDAHNARTEALAAEARAIHAQEVAACRAIGVAGAALIPSGATILTHCNAGALATGGYGTALGVIRAAHDAQKKVRVLATETRPYLQGARLTAWELARDGIPVEIIPDSAAGHFFARKAIDAVVVGADRIARNGDVANKIGTYMIAALAQMHGVPLYVAAPWSTVDLACANGDAIPIEERSEREVTHFPTGELDVPIAPEGVGARNPAFDVTPARLVRAIFTERGVVTPVDEARLVALEKVAT
jgi:methylthioribose-1-phosphate isomerase